MARKRARKEAEAGRLLEKPCAHCEARSAYSRGLAHQKALLSANPEANQEHGKQKQDTKTLTDTLGKS
ncbi:unnamed protein product [Penicillium palitans]